MDDLFKNAFKHYGEDKKKLNVGVDLRLKHINKQMVKFLDENNIKYKRSTRGLEGYDWYNFEGEYLHFNIQIREDNGLPNVVIFIFDNAFMVNRWTLNYKIQSIESINNDFNKWVVDNTLKYLLMKY